MLEKTSSRLHSALAGVEVTEGALTLVDLLEHKGSEHEREREMYRWRRVANWL